MSNILTPKETLEVLLKDLKHRLLVRKDGDENIQRDYIKIVESAFNQLKELESQPIIVVSSRMSGKPYRKISITQRLFDLEKFLKIIKEDFYVNGLDEFIPKSGWYDNDEKQNFIKEMLR